MTYFYLPPTSLKYIDAKPLEARYLALIALIKTYIDIGRHREMERASYRMARTVKAYIKVLTHNDLLTRKLDMLASPIWRKRVLKDLGGLRKLKLWDKAFQRAQGDLPKRRVAPRPKDPEPVWWRMPERIAESERLKAHARRCAKACVSEGTYRDPYKLDCDGMFRLAPLPRAKRQGVRKLTIYSELTIGEYEYNAVPVYKPEGLGIATVWPMEFYAAMALEAEDQNAISKDVIPHAEPKAIGTSSKIDSGSAGFALVRDDKTEDPEDKDEWYDIIDDMIDRDINVLANFIGINTYRYVFENPI